jgi:hypothetical protein
MKFDFVVISAQSFYAMFSRPRRRSWTIVDAISTAAIASEAADANPYSFDGLANPLV